MSHHAQVRAVLEDWRNFSNAGGAGITNLFKEGIWRRPSIILEVDPPEHERTRRVLMRVLSARALKAMLPDFQAVARDLIDRALDLGDFEAVTELHDQLKGLPTGTVRKLLRMGMKMRKKAG